MNLGEPIFTRQEEPKELMRRKGQKSRRKHKKTQGGMRFQKKEWSRVTSRAECSRIKTDKKHLDWHLGVTGGLGTISIRNRG